jgi:hypothetical protein
MLLAPSFKKYLIALGNFFYNLNLTNDWKVDGMVWSLLNPIDLNLILPSQLNLLIVGANHN